MRGSWDFWCAPSKKPNEQSGSAAAEQVTAAVKSTFAHHSSSAAQSGKKDGLDHVHLWCSHFNDSQYLLWYLGKALAFQTLNGWILVPIPTCPALEICHGAPAS